jgi:hypothetical protein
MCALPWIGIALLRWSLVHHPCFPRVCPTLSHIDRAHFTKSTFMVNWGNQYTGKLWGLFRDEKADPSKTGNDYIDNLLKEDAKADKRFDGIKEDIFRKHYKTQAAAYLVAVSKDGVGAGGASNTTMAVAAQGMCLKMAC